MCQGAQEMCALCKYWPESKCVCRKCMHICAEWRHYSNETARTKPNIRDTIADHLFVYSTCNVKCVGTAWVAEESNVPKTFKER